MIKTTRWSPDTCGCILEYSWDDSIPEDQRVHTPAVAVQKCPAHEAINNTAQHHDVVLEENQRKNITLKDLVEAHPELAKTDEKGNKTPDSEKISFSFDETRTLIIDAPTISAKQKGDFEKSQVDKQGAGKVKIQ